MQKVLEVFAEPFSNGGQEAFFMNVIQKINMDNLNIDILTPYYIDNKYYKRILFEKGCKTYSWNLPFKPNKSRLFYIGLFTKFFKRHKYDVVHIHSGSTTALAYIAFAAKVTGIKKIITHSHCTGAKHNLKYYCIKMVTYPFFKLSVTDYYACSKEAGEWKYPRSVSEKKVQIIRNGIDIEKFLFNADIRKRIRNELNLDAKTVLLGHVGRFSLEKNQTYLIDLLEELGERFKLLLIGTGEEFDGVKRKVKDYNLTDRVIFKGNVNDVYDYMQAMDVFLFPSTFEGLGIVAIEAQASGLPVIASKNVPSDIEITPLVKRVDLKDKKKWLEYIKKISPTNNRDDFSDVIIRCGFGIDDTCNVIRDAYLS